jgi:putative tryptophan/tyrosine transport system substrate-binding protein
MRRREFIALLGSLALQRAAQAQQAIKVFRIGFLGSISASKYASQVEALLAGLHDLGYVDGKNITIEFRWAEGNYDRLPELAAELERLKVDVLVTHGTPATIAAKGATKTIPIVSAAIGDPLAAGVVTGAMEPGGNITGVAIFSPELGVKRLELLTQAIPNVKQVAVVLNPENALVGAILQGIGAAAASLAVELQQIAVRASNEFENVLSPLGGGRVQAVVLVDDGMLIANAASLGKVITNLRLPSVGFTEFAHGGGLIGYGVNFPEMFRRAAIPGGQDSEGRQAGRPAYRAGEPVRSHRQSHDCKSARAYDPANAACPGERGDRMRQKYRAVSADCAARPKEG